MEQKLTFMDEVAELKHIPAVTNALQDTIRLLDRALPKICIHLLILVQFSLHGFLAALLGNGSSRISFDIVMAISSAILARGALGSSTVTL